MWLETPEDQQNNINGQPSNNLSVGTGGGTASAGQTSSGISGNPSTIAPVQSNQPQQKFATVQDYLKSNQPQGEALGQQLSSKLGESATNEQNTISNAATQASNDINAGSVSYDPNLVSKALSNPTDVAGNPDQLNSFLKQWNASYSGPQSFETSNSYTDAANAANAAAQKAAEVKTTGGREQLLQDQFNVYGQGNKGLDQALLQTSSAFPTIQQQGKTFSSIPDYLASQAGNVNNQATAAQTATDLAKTNTQNAFTNNLANFQNKINQNVAASRQYATEHPSSANGITLNPNVDINAGNVASPQEYANAQAYNKLTGVDYSGVLNPANAAQASTQNALLKLQGQRNAIINAPNPAQGQINQLKQELNSIISTNLTPAQRDAITQSYNQQIADLQNKYAQELSGVTSDYDREINKLKGMGAYSKGGIVKPQNILEYLKGKTR